MAENLIALCFEVVAKHQAALEALTFEAPEAQTLPTCGLTVIVRRPKPAFLGLAFKGLQQFLPSVAGHKDISEFSGTEALVTCQLWADLWAKVFVRPRLSLDPSIGEMSPNRLKPADVDFLVRWVVGENRTLRGQA